MGAGLARGASVQGHRIAFGHSGRITWSDNAKQIYLGNPNVAPPGDERAHDLKWVPHYSGHRLYNRFDGTKSRWIWNYDFHAQPGQLFFSEPEKAAAATLVPNDFVLVEPNLPMWKSVAINKLWRGYQEVTDELLQRGIGVIQFDYPGIKNRLRGARLIQTPTIRLALACLNRVRLYIGPEGGLHHGAAAFNLPAVVLFGGFIPPSVTGYESHANLTGGAKACGSITRCPHCEQAMRRITVDEVMAHANRFMSI
jgi:hypothetical protein